MLSFLPLLRLTNITDINPLRALTRSYYHYRSLILLQNNLCYVEHQMLLLLLLFFIIIIIIRHLILTGVDLDYGKIEHIHTHLPFSSLL